MKKFLLSIILAFTTIMSAQETKEVPKGFLTTVLNERIEFNNLKTENNQVEFYNVSTQSKFTYMLSTVKKIENASGATVYLKAGTAEAPTPSKVIAEEIEPASSTQNLPEKAEFQDNSIPLKYVSIREMTLGDQKLKPADVRKLYAESPSMLKHYNTGKSLATLGTISLGMGVGLFVAGTSIIVSATSKVNSGGFTSQQNLGGGVATAGLAFAVVSIPLIIISRNQVKKSVEEYNNAIKNSKGTTLLMLINGNGVGLAYKM